MLTSTMAIHTIVTVSIPICRMMFAHYVDLSSLLGLICEWMLFGRLRCRVCFTHGKSVTWNYLERPGNSFKGFEAIYKQMVMSLKKSLNSTHSSVHYTQVLDGLLYFRELCVWIWKPVQL